MDSELRIEAGEAVSVNPTNTSSCMGVSWHIFTQPKLYERTSLEIFEYISPCRGLHIRILKRNSYLTCYAIFQKYQNRFYPMADMRRAIGRAFNAGREDDHTFIFLPGDSCIRTVKA